MVLKKWDDLPEFMRCDEVKMYYNIISHHKASLIVKRIFDIIVSLLMLVMLLPLFIAISITIKIDSRGPVFFRQLRVTTYGKTFRIFKFRTMVVDAEKRGSQVTTKNDNRITKIGSLIRKCRLDEIGQLIDVLRGTMTFVGVRPEVPKYVAKYTPEMRATLLLPAGVTNRTSIYFKDESQLLSGAADADQVYVEKVLPGKMYWNLEGIKDFSFRSDIKLMFMTFFAVCGKQYKASSALKSMQENLSTRIYIAD